VDIAREFTKNERDIPLTPLNSILTAIYRVFIIYILFLYSLLPILSGIVVIERENKK